jgi:putative transposase
MVGDGQLRVEYPPTLSVSSLVNHLKGVSSRMLRKEFPELAALGAQVWTPSYFAASAGGAPIERPREYGGGSGKAVLKEGICIPEQPLIRPASSRDHCHATAIPEHRGIQRQVQVLVWLLPVL